MENLNAKQLLQQELDDYIARQSGKNDIGETTLHQPAVIYSTVFGSVDLGEMESSFSESVMESARKKYKKVSDFYERANLSRQVVSRMNMDPSYLPTKKNAFACVVALELSPEEAEKLLKRGSYSFSNSNLMDLIVKFFLEKKIYDVDQINEVLYTYGQPTLGSVY